MKRLLTISLIFCLLLSATTVNAFAADTANSTGESLTQEYTDLFHKQLYRGDLDNNGKVTIDEAKQYLRIAAKLEDPQAGVDYDMTGDGKITTDDARRVLRIASGLETAATNEEIFEYFKKELNSVKKEFPGFERTTVSTCTSAKVTITDAPKGLLYDFNATNEEYVDYLKRNEKMLKMADEAEYNKMLAEAQAVYKPIEKTKTVAPGSTSHYSYFPVVRLTYACNLDFNEVKSITFKQDGGSYIITIKLGSYTYNEKNPYPATVYDDAERQKLPYGKIFNIPEFNDTSSYELKKVVLDKGEVILKVDAETGKILTVDYSYQCTSSVYTEAELKDDSGKAQSTMKTTMTNVIKNQEHFVLN